MSFLYSPYSEFFSFLSLISIVLNNEKLFNHLLIINQPILIKILCKLF